MLNALSNQANITDKRIGTQTTMLTTMDYSQRRYTNIFTTHGVTQIVFEGQKTALIL